MVMGKFLFSALDVDYFLCYNISHTFKTLNDEQFDLLS